MPVMMIVRNLSCKNAITQI
ncbi:hypothetical protein LINPERHAP2_LOCUS14821 [Linum perenne]